MAKKKKTKSPKKQSAKPRAHSNNPGAAKATQRPAPKTKKKSAAKRVSRKRARAKIELPHEDVQRAAYHLYEERIGNGGHGDENSDWFEAERMLMR